MNKKVLERLCILFVVTVFIIIGYSTYKSYEDKKSSNDNTVEINNFYNVEYLFNNSYIDTPQTIEDFSDEKGDIYIYLDASNVMYIKYTDAEENNKKITGLPGEKVTVYYNHLHDPYYEFLSKTEKGAVYYTFVNLSSSSDEKFSLIGKDIDKVYIPVYDKAGVYINEDDDFATKYIMYGKDENLKYIDTSFNKYTLKSHLESKRPYFDYICADINSYLCNKFMIYISFENELVYDKKSLENNNNEIIHAKDVFSSYEIKSQKNIDIKKLNKKSLKKYKYIFSTYIIDENQLAYQFDITNKGESIIPLNSEKNKVKECIYEADKKLLIIFEDGTEKEIKSSKNRVITTSTIYDKKERNNDKVLIKP